MVHRDNLVAAIKCGGQILREIDGTVTLPFGSEYSVLVKNLNSVRMQVSVSVDGKDATDGTRLIVNANSSVELERFIRNGNLNEGNRLKFIERTGEIEQHRGIGVDDGLVRIEAWTEVVRPVVHEPIIHYYDDWRPRSRPWRPPRHPYPPIFTARAAGATSSIHASTEDSVSMSDVGITVPGAVSNQQFYSALGFELEPQSRVVVLRLRGSIGGQPVAQPITVAHKPTCATCGKTNKADSKFCACCGTALVLI